MRFKFKAYVMIVFLIMSLYNVLLADISKTQAINIVMTEIVVDDSINVYMEPDIQTGNIYNINPYKTINVNYLNYWLFFIDDHPMYNWGHDCRYVFVRISDGVYQIENEITCPLEYKVNFDEVSIVYVEMEYEENIGDPVYTESREPDEHKYAIFISGRTERRHWNNMSAMYATLKNEYGFMDENMIVLSYDGTTNPNGTYGNYSLDLDNDLVNDIQANVICNVENVGNAFQFMQENLGTDDILFVYGNNHGTMHPSIPFRTAMDMYQGELFWDYQMAGMVDQINCSEIIFALDFCYSGGFRDDLEGERRTIHTAVEWDEWSITMADFEFDFFSYFWTTAVRRYHPFSEDEPWLKDEPIGTHDTAQYISNDFDPDLLIHEGNGDGITQMGEAFYYVNQMSIQIPHETTNIGFHEDLMTLSGLTGSIENTQTVSGDFVIGNYGITVADNVTLQISDNSNFYLNDEARITTNTLSNLIIGTNVKFEGVDLDNQGEIELNAIGTTIFNNTHFQYCNLSSTNGNLTITNSDFVGCKLVCEDGVLNIVDSEFDGENCDYDSGIWCNNNSEVVLDNIIVENYFQGIRLNYPDVFDISNSISRNNATQCFSVFNSRSHLNTIYNSQFYGSSAIGLLSYGSSLTATSCNISQNGRGVFLMNRSNVTIEKESESNPWELDSVIAENSWEEILFYDDCRLHLADRRNKIMDNSYTPGTSDEFLINCPNLITERDFSYNYWGYTDMYNNAILPPDNRFNPEGAFQLSPVYDPGIPREDGKPDDQILYETAVTEAENGNTTQAEIMLKDLITQYPESNYKRSAASYLLAIQEEDFQALKAYFNGEPNLHSDDLIELYTAYLQTYCDIQSENYQEAIDWLESIITNPPSLVDSVYAVIDLGDLYLQINGNNRGAVGNYPHLIPQSKEKFEQTREDLFALLSEEYNYENEPGEEPSNDYLPTCATLNSNYPNPFNPTTTISFSIPDDSKIELSVFNIKGQKVRSLVKDSFESGTHSVVWDGVDDLGKSVSSGVYFYKLKVDGKEKAVRKCLMLK